MILVDSCGWLEFFTNGPLAQEYEHYLNTPEELITPTLVLYEVSKKITRERGEEAALFTAAQMYRTKLVPLTPELALLAADLSLRYSLPMADAVVYATAMSERCQIVTSDSHFAGLERVVFLGKNH